MHVVEVVLQNIRQNKLVQLVCSWHSNATLANVREQRASAVRKVSTRYIHASSHPACNAASLFALLFPTLLVQVCRLQSPQQLLDQSLVLSSGMQVPILLRAAKEEMGRLKSAAALLLAYSSRSRSVALCTQAVLSWTVKCRRTASRGSVVATSRFVGRSIAARAQLRALYTWKTWTRTEYYNALTSADIVLHMRSTKLSSVLVRQLCRVHMVCKSFHRLVTHWRSSKSNFLTMSGCTTPDSTPRKKSGVFRAQLSSQLLTCTMSGRRRSPKALAASKIPSSPLANSLRSEAEKAKNARRVLRSLRLATQASENKENSCCFSSDVVRIDTLKPLCSAGSDLSSFSMPHLSSLGCLFCCVLLVLCLHLSSPLSPQLHWFRMLQSMNILWQALSLWVFGREDVVSALESVQSQLDLGSPNTGEITYTPACHS